MKHLLALVCLVFGCAVTQPIIATTVAQDDRQVSRADFDLTVSEWKEVCKKFRKLKYDFVFAREDEAEQLMEKHDKLVSEGNLLLGRAIRQAAKLFPTERDPELRDFLLTTRTRLLDLGYLETALDVGIALLDGGSGELLETDLMNMMTLVQIANFCSEYEKAADLLGRIKQVTGAMPSHMEKFLEQQPKLSADWESEKELRKQEESAGKLPRVRINTNKGSVEIELFEDHAPNSVAHFLDLVERGSYDGNDFYEVFQNGLALTGSLANDGQFDARYIIESEHDLGSARPHHRGVVTLLAIKDGRQASSIFAICRVTNPALNGRQTVIGRVISGMSVIDQLNNSVTMDEEGKPVRSEKFTPDLIVSAKIIRPSTNPVEPTRASVGSGATDNSGSQSRN